MSQEPEETQNVVNKSNKNGIIGIFIIIGIIISIGFFINSKTLKSISQFYVKFRTPITSYLIDMPVESFPVMFREGNIPITVYTPRAEQLYIYFESKGFNKSLLKNDNFLYNFLTFGNSNVRSTLDAAYLQGRYIMPYDIFVFEKDKALYEGKLFNASSILLYGYTWLINLPAKFLNIIDSQLQAGKNPYSGHNSFWIFIIDDIWLLICTLFIDIPIAIINTIVGFFISLICHPIDSIIGIPGAIYYGIISTFYAIWDILANIIMIPYHFFK